MRYVCVWALAGMIGAMALPQASHEATAKPAVKTKYTYYTISGTSARNLYQQMISRGPHVSGDRALAATRAETRQSGDFVMRKSCRVKNYKIGINFTIKLPKVANERKLPKRLRRDWRKFYKFVRSHELQHKAIWIGCARQVERKVRAIRASTCRSADSQANKIFRAVAKACEAKHDAFDRAEQKRLARHPLVVAAKRVPRRSKTKTKTRAARATAKVTARRYVGGRAADDF